jgi:streptogramin lyase
MPLFSRCVGHKRVASVAWLCLATCGGCAGPRYVSSRQETIGYPPKPAEVRVIALGPIGGSLTRKSETSALRRFVTGEEGDQPDVGLIRPVSVAVRGGEVLVCDVGLGAVVRIDPAGGTIKPLLRRSTRQPLKPVAVAVSPAGDAFIADAGAHAILRVDPTGVVRTQYGLSAAQDKFEPIGVAASTDRVYAVNRASRTVEVFELESGRPLGPLGGSPSTRGSDEPLFPVAVSVDGAGRVYVVDVLKCQVGIYAPDGRSITRIGGPGDRPGQFARPRSVAVGPDGTIFVSDAASQVVQVFSPIGGLLMSFGGPGSDAGAMALPTGLWTDVSLVERFRARLPDDFEPSYLILVASQLGPGRIGVYAFGKAANREAGQSTSTPVDLKQ